MKRSLLLFTAILILLCAKAQAQSGFDQLIKSTPGDASKLINAYSDPLFKELGFGLNTGWNNTAKSKGLLHFDLRITATAPFAPSSAKSFDVTQIGLSYHVKPATANTISPTFIGNGSAGPSLNVYDDNGNKVSSFNMPGGQINVVPTPQIQLTIGIIKNTDVSIRAIPKTTVSSDVGTVSMFGFGLKHDIVQDFGTAGKLIPFDLALAFGYSRLNYNKSLNVQPESGAQPVNAQQSTDFTNQRIDGHLNSFMLQAILSKQILFFTPYVSVAYNTATTNVGLLGNYPITTNATITGPKYTSYTNPVTIDQKSVNGVRGEVGFQLSLAVFKIYGSYGIAQQYNLINAGIGLGF